MPNTTIFSAKKIITMNPSRPEASHVAVRDGRILGAGSLEELATWGDYTRKHYLEWVHKKLDEGWSLPEAPSLDILIKSSTGMSSQRYLEVMET